jgi:hypothetical protein
METSITGFFSCLKFGAWDLEFQTGKHQITILKFQANYKLEYPNSKREQG